MRAGQAGLVETLLPRIAVPAEGPVTAERAVRRMTARSISRSASAGASIWPARADMLPDHGFIGAEPFLNGVAQALVHVDGETARACRSATCACTTAMRWRCWRACPTAR